MIYLETDRLLLRRFRPEDFGDFWEYANDPEMCRMMGRPDLSDREAAMANFRWLLEKEPEGYCLCLKEGGKVIGNLTVTAPPPEVTALDAVRGKDGRSLSFCVGKHWQRQGYAEEAVRAVIEAIFRDPAISYIHCGHFDFNEASRAFQEKLGFARLTETRIETPQGVLRGIENIRWRNYFIKTPRLTIRRFRREDFEDYCAYALDPKMARMIGIEDIHDPAMSFEKLLRRPRVYALVLESEGKVIGDLAVETLPPSVQKVKALQGKRGYALSFSISRDFRRRGLMEEAVRGVIGQLFRGEQLDFVNCGYFDFNEPSRQLQTKLGFQPLVTHWVYRGSEKIRVMDNVIWRENWEENL